MISAPVLALPDFTQHFVIEADACDKGIGAVLMQKQRPIAFLSNALSPRNQGLSVYEKEFLAILQAVQKWKHYVIGHHFIIKTDHQSLKHILEQRVDNALQQRWISKLLGLIMKSNINGKG
ncbi:UNVERIFIED_CONTAM: Retrovirus-related Pol polyprotein from transposon.6 [Sesamum angustifolium]|uniref:Retrovirus-related Pol polyprotein from transposon.6 n=1 Tax=Sesamum angustifolium TaxID=2727405 RepID=A0AAW2QTR7_9LAMI